MANEVKDKYVIQTEGESSYSVWDSASSTQYNGRFVDDPVVMGLPSLFEANRVKDALMCVQSQLTATTAKLEQAEAELEALREAIDEIEPAGWNNGCGCCSYERLEESSEWKKVAALARTTEGVE